MTENRHIRRSAARRPAGAEMAHRSWLSPWLLALTAFLALAIQSFIVQTHIHIPQGQGRGQTVSLITLVAAAVADRPHAAGDMCTARTPRDRYPINEDPSNCPLCQEVAHSGQFVQSAAVLAALPFSASAHFTDFDEALPSFFSVSHIWLGRAPPAS